MLSVRPAATRYDSEAGLSGSVATASCCCSCCCCCLAAGISTVSFTTTMALVARKRQEGSAWGVLLAFLAFPLGLVAAIAAGALFPPLALVGLAVLVFLFLKGLELAGSADERARVWSLLLLAPVFIGLTIFEAVLALDASDGGGTYPNYGLWVGGLVVGVALAFLVGGRAPGPEKTITFPSGPDL